MALQLAFSLRAEGLQLAGQFVRTEQCLKFLVCACYQSKHSLENDSDYRRAAAAAAKRFWESLGTIGQSTQSCHS